MDSHRLGPLRKRFQKAPSRTIQCAPMAASPEIARARALLLRTLRDGLERRGYLEVETPIAVPVAGQEPHLRPFETRFVPDLPVPPGGVEGARRLHLITSPEYAMKRLLARPGFSRIFQFARVFRDGEVSPAHNPEFTLLEFYAAPGDAALIMQHLEELVAECARALNGSATAPARAPRSRGRTAIDLATPYERLSCREAFLRHAAAAAGELGRRLHADPGARRRAGSGPLASGVSDRVSRFAGGPLPSQRQRPARGRALRAVCRRARAVQRVHRADRCVRAAPAAAFRAGRARAAGARRLSARRALPRRAPPDFGRRRSGRRRRPAPDAALWRRLDRRGAALSRRRGVSHGAPGGPRRGSRVIVLRFLRTVLGLPVIFVSMVLFACLIWLSGETDFSEKVLRLWCRVVLALAGARVTARQLAPLDPKSSYVFVSNHTSNMDVPAILAV